MSIVQSAQDSLLSLYLINDAEHGGFGFDQTDIGWLYTGIGPIQIIFNHILLSFNLICFLHSTSDLSPSCAVVFLSGHLFWIRYDLRSSALVVSMHFSRKYSVNACISLVFYSLRFVGLSF